MPALPPARASKRPKCDSRAIEREIREALPPEEIDTIIDNIGIPQQLGPASPQGDMPTISSADGEILISLNERSTDPRGTTKCCFASACSEKFPDMAFFFQPANITNQILNFGLARADRSAGGGARRGRQLQNRPEARAKESRISPAPPTCMSTRWSTSRRSASNVDRVKASQLGLTQRDVSTNMLISLSGTSQVAPNFWVNWTNGVNYNVGVQTPQYQDRLARCAAAHADLRGQQRGEYHDAGFAGGRGRHRNASVGASPSGASQAYGNPGSHRRQHAAAFESGDGRSAITRP